MSPVAQPWYGKYRGIVVDVDDPAVLGRIRVLVPAVLGAEQSSWALPCVPVTDAVASCIALPAVGANVWVEFEQGDPNYPIWIGHWWQAPADVSIQDIHRGAVDQHISLQTIAGQRIVFDNQQIIIEDIYGNQVVLSSSGVRITSSARITVHASTLDIHAAAITVNSSVTRFSGVVQADTVITNAVVSSSYTPGAGSSWS